MTKIRTIVAMGLLCGTQMAHAYPENVRNGYNNCTACHFSPTGGGVLTAYGRQLSREILSNSGHEGEEQLLHGLVRTSNAVTLGGDWRDVQTYLDSPRMKRARFIVMQADLEPAITVGKVTVVGTIGIEKIEKQATSSPRGVLSRRHYVNYKPTDEVSLRAGRFMPAFGINVADHVIATKQGLGFDQHHETYNFEAAWLGETVNLHATAIFGRHDKIYGQLEKGAALTPGVFLLEKHKVGASYFYGYTSGTKRHLFGPWAILGFTPRFFLLSEWDYQMFYVRGQPTPSRTGVAGYQRLDYEAWKGIHFYLTQEYSMLDRRDNSSFKEGYGIGAQVFPRPHFEINALWQKQRMFSVSKSAFYDYAWLMFHYYL